MTYDDGMTYENDHHVDIVFRNKEDAIVYCAKKDKSDYGGVCYDWEETDLVE